MNKIAPTYTICLEREWTVDPELAYTRARLRGEHAQRSLGNRFCTCDLCISESGPVWIKLPKKKEYMRKPEIVRHFTSLFDANHCEKAPILSFFQNTVPRKEFLFLLLNFTCFNKAATKRLPS